MKNKQQEKCNALLGQAQQLAATGKLAEAEATLARILEIDREHKIANLLLAQLAFQSNRPVDSAQFLQKVIELDPADAQPYYFLAQVLARLGQSDNAIQAYHHALSLKPDFIDAQIGAGNLLLMLGRSEEAAQEYKQALQIKNDHAPLYYNLAIAQAASGRISEALHNYERATSLNRDYDAAFYNLAILKRSIGDTGGALEACTQATRLAPKQKLYWQLFVECVRSIDLDDIKFEIENDILRCLRIDNIDHSGLIIAVKGLVEHNCIPEELYKLHETASSASLVDAVRKNVLASLYRYEPLLLLLERELIKDCELELFLTDLRYAFTRVLSEQDISEDIDLDAVRFLAALGQQCFLNDFVYYKHQEECELITALRVKVLKILKTGGSVSDGLLALLSCYENLNSTIYNLPTAKIQGTVITRLIDLQVTRLNQEKELEPSITTLSVISTPMTDPVHLQYEETIYPRWVDLPFTTPRPAHDVFGQLFPHLLRNGVKFPDAPSILVAGCGTGRHALLTAMRFNGSSVTAFDLSRPKLAFALNKARKLRIKNITFVQADILQIDDTLGTYDIVDTVGILHHLENPLEGIRKLYDHVQPCGFMKIGLYSYTGSRTVRAAQQLAREWGLDATASRIRDFRHRIMKMDKSTESYKLTCYTDFFSLSKCRELMFRSREHWFTIPQIGQMLEELGLRFIGFELEVPAVLQHYKTQYPQDPDATSLTYWHEFELKNPYIFASMYKFWVQPPQ